MITQTNSRFLNCSHDSNGNLIQQISGGGNLVTGDGHYREYNEFGQLERIRDGNADTSPILEEYWYDHEGQRTKTKRYDSANTYIYTPFKEFMMIKNDSGTFNYTYIYDGNTLVARINADESKWFYHPDYLGSTSLITDENGILVEENQYYPYGATYSGGTSEIRGYEGKEQDSTGQQYFGARYYDPEKRLWIQPDPIMDMYNPQNLNRYSFELNNPYKYIDPDGRNVRVYASRDSAPIPFFGPQGHIAIGIDDPNNANTELIFENKGLGNNLKGNINVFPVKSSNKYSRYAMSLTGEYNAITEEYSKQLRNSQNQIVLPGGYDDYYEIIQAKQIDMKMIEKGLELTSNPWKYQPTSHSSLDYANEILLAGNQNLNMVSNNPNRVFDSSKSSNIATDYDNSQNTCTEDNYFGQSSSMSYG